MELDLDLDPSEICPNLEKLSNDLKNLFQNQNEKNEESYFDFEIICEQDKTSFKTHKAILSSRSQYFKSLLNSKMKEYQENKLILKDVPSSILSSILNYLYSGKIEISLENVVQILMFSSKYLIDELIESVTDFLKYRFKIENVVDILKLSESMNLTELTDLSYEFIFRKFNEFVEAPFFLELEENHLNSILSNENISKKEFELFQLIIKWGKHKSNINQEKENQKLEKEEKEQLQNQISNLIYKIRFIDFSKKELKDILKEDLIPNQISQKLIQFQKLQNDRKNAKKRREFIRKNNSIIFKPRFKLESTILQQREYFKLLRKWINDDKFFFKMKKGFSLQKEGNNCQIWHEICDNKGKTLVLIKTKDNFIFGGYTSVGFKSSLPLMLKLSDDNHEQSFYIEDPKAFIFSIRNDKGDRKPEKLPIKKGKESSALLYNYFYHGPIFGGGADLALSDNISSGYSNLGYSYQLPKGIDPDSFDNQHYLAGSFIEVDEVETFFI